MRRTMKVSQTEKVRRALLAGRRLTPLEAVRDGMGMRLGARIWDLRQTGMDISDKMVRVAGGSWVKEYWVERDAMMEEVG